MKNSLLALSLCLASCLAQAADSNGLVTQPLTTQWGYGMFGVGTAGGFSGTKPACATNPQSSHWAIEIKTPTGRAMWASVLQAHALGKPVWVHGKGNCDWWGDRESVDYIVISD
jgi:opacity protein-like surface antigen